MKLRNGTDIPIQYAPSRAEDTPRDGLPVGAPESQKYKRRDQIVLQLIRQRPGDVVETSPGKIVNEQEFSEQTCMATGPPCWKKARQMIRLKYNSGASLR